MKKISLDVRRTARSAVRLPFERLAERILPKGYRLSLVLCGDTLSRRLNREHRGKTYAPNVLSFPIARNEGEIFINIRVAAREARRYRVPLQARIAHLFVHGCAHLRGLPHGNTMDALEARTLRALGFTHW